MRWIAGSSLRARLAALVVAAALVPLAVVTSFDPVALTRPRLVLDGFAVVVIVAAAILVARALVRPLAALADRAAALAPGDLPAPAATTAGHDDLARLAASVDRMAARIDAQDAALGRVRGELDARVAELGAPGHAADRRADDALRRSEARFRRLSESGIIGIVHADTLGNIHDVNDAFLGIVGYTREDLAAGRIGSASLNPPEWQDRQAAARVELAATGRTQPWEKEFVRKDGSRVPVLIGVAMLDAPDCLNIVVDLTGQKRAEAAVRRLADEREADARFRALLEAAPDAMVVVDAAGAIALVNAEAERLFGYPRAELLGQPVERLMPAARRDAHETQRAGYARAPSTRPIRSGLDLVARRKDGSEFPVEISLSPLATEGGVLVSSAIRDITERRRTEAELRRARDEAQTASRELEAFSYSVAHDLRAPLRAIHGFSAALVEDHAGALDAQARHYLDRIGAAAGRMGKLIDALLDLARVARVELSREPLRLDEIARAVIAQLRAGDPGRAVEVDIEDGLRGDGDPHLVRVVLENLLGNAWKFTERRAPGRIAVGRALQGGAWAYFVRDDGAGFDMAYANKLFTPFQRLHKASDFAGTGIGLATVERIVHRHGGSIRAEGVVDAGATFWFTLAPAQRAQE